VSENHAARAHPEHVVLDIGGTFGAVIIYTDPDLHGREIEISPTGDDQRRTHKDVLDRSRADNEAFTAVFDRVGEGTYTFWLNDEARSRDVRVDGGAITELDWRR
jgi:hypothetical protein